MVSARPHQSGTETSTLKLSTVSNSQKIFFCIGLIIREGTQFRN